MTDEHVSIGHSAELRITNEVQSKDNVKLPQKQISGMPADEHIDPTDGQNNSKLQVTDEVQNKDIIEPPDEPQKQVADIPVDEHIDPTYRQNNAELQVTGEMQNKEPNGPQKQITDIPADGHVFYRQSARQGTEWASKANC